MHSASPQPGASPRPRIPSPEAPDRDGRLGPDWLLSWQGLVIVAALFGLFVFCSSLALDYLLLVHKDSPLATVEVSDALAGALAGILFLKILAGARRRRQLILQRLETIEQMNHHIRNALQVISFSVHANQEPAQEVANIDRAVKRIQWALNEILPKM
jgi:hypothetical protein